MLPKMLQVLTGSAQHDFGQKVDAPWKKVNEIFQKVGAILEKVGAILKKSDET